MQQIRISKLKATCLAVLDRVAATAEPVLVTRFGKPVARLLPPPRHPRAAWFGAMRGTCKMHDDLIAPASDPSDREALKES